MDEPHMHVRVKLILWPFIHQESGIILSFSSAQPPFDVFVNTNEPENAHQSSDARLKLGLRHLLTPVYFFYAAIAATVVVFIGEKGLIGSRMRVPHRLRQAPPHIYM